MNKLAKINRHCRTEPTPKFRIDRKDVSSHTRRVFLSGRLKSPGLDSDENPRGKGVGGWTRWFEEVTLEVDGRKMA
jgi:hypothetical protein